MITVDCLADCHGHYPKLEGGDLLIVAGDLTARDSVIDHMRFQMWLHEQDYKKRIIIAGNHDNRLQQFPFESIKRQYAETGEDYLCDSGTEFEGLKIWGSPWTLRFPGMNPHCMAFTVDTEEELAEKFSKIPSDIDILITHSPAAGFLDKNIYGKKCGSLSLLDALSRIQPRLHVYGHLHESYGKIDECAIVTGPQHKFRRLHISINASHVNEHYEPVNKPMRIEL